MRPLESWVLAYLLNSLWQVPLVFCAAMAAARLARPAGPQLQHRVWVGALFLEAFLPACNIHFAELLGRASGWVLWFRQGSAVDGETRIILGAGSTAGSALPWLSANVLTGIAILYLCALLYFAVRLAWGLWTTEVMRRRATRLILTGVAAESQSRLRRLLGIPRAVDFAVSSEIMGPATVGVHRHTLLLPPGFLHRLGMEDLDAILAHEFAHMQRRDFAKNMLYGILSLPVNYHPLLALTRTRIAETREMQCDALAAQAVGGRTGYARSLLRLASILSDRVAPRLLHAIGILDANTFERRVMNLNRKSLPLGQGRRLLIAAACLLVAFAACGSAIALRLNVADQPDQKSAPLKVKVGQLTIITKVPPIYPMEAKAKKDTLNGPVVLKVIVGKDGAVKNITVQKSLREDYDQAAMDAVRQWRYQPYLLNGDPIEVETTVTITYMLKK